MTASERLERLAKDMRGAREWPLDLGSPLGRNHGQSWDLSFQSEEAIKDVLRALPELIAVVEAAEDAADHFIDQSAYDRIWPIELKDALTALERKLGSK